MAIALMRNTGEPSPSSAYGITDANGHPACFCEFVASVPTRSLTSNVRVRSACVGSDPGGGGGEEEACWVMGGSMREFGTISGMSDIDAALVAAKDDHRGRYVYAQRVAEFDASWASDHSAV